MIHASALVRRDEAAHLTLTDTRGQQRRGGLYLDEVLPLLFTRADSLLDAAQLVEDGLSLVQLVVRLTAGHLPVDPASQNTRINTLA